jgi:putative restriction endonuclease
MNADELRLRFNSLTVWRRGGERAPHKPLLVIYAIARLLRGKTRMVEYAEVDRDLGKLLLEFALRGNQSIQNTCSGGCRTMGFGN